MGDPVSDRIEKQIVLNATRSRVWRALADAVEFGAWFGFTLEGPFAVGRRVKGRSTHPGYEHMTMEVAIERMDAEGLFSFRWHPAAVDPQVDYSAEPETLVELRLEEAAKGTLLTVVESGFDRIPAARRAEAYRMNTRGWAAQLENVRRHVAG